jgi:hypothetical protein
VRIHYLTLYLVAARWPIRSVSHNFVEVQQYFIYIKEQRLEPIELTPSEASIFRDSPYPDLWVAALVETGSASTTRKERLKWAGSDFRLESAYNFILPICVTFREAYSIGRYGQL